MTGSGAAANYYGMGVGQHHGGGLAVVNSIDPAQTSGTLTDTSLPSQTLDSNGNRIDSDLAGATLYLTRGGLPLKTDIIASASIASGHAGWMPC